MLSKRTHTLTHTQSHAYTQCKCYMHQTDDIVHMNTQGVSTIGVKHTQKQSGRWGWGEGEGEREREREREREKGASHRLIK